MSQTYRYHTCPACAHPNVHCEKADTASPWRYRRHYASQTGRPCPAGGLPVAGVPRSHPIGRDSPQHVRERAQCVPV